MGETFGDTSLGIRYKGNDRRKKKNKGNDRKRRKNGGISQIDTADIICTNFQKALIITTNYKIYINIFCIKKLNIFNNILTNHQKTNENENIDTKVYDYMSKILEEE
jgi:hypothetical protein